LHRQAGTVPYVEANMNPVRNQDFKLTKGFLMGDGILKERRFLTG